MKLTRSDLEKKKARLAHYQSQLNALRRSEIDPADNEHIGFCYNAGQALMMEQETILISLIQNEQAEIDNAEIIDQLEIPEDVVGLGDSVTLLIHHEGEEPIETILTISDELVEDLSIVTTSSPIGLAIYGKHIGETVSCQTPIGKTRITILEKTRAIVR